MKFLLAGTAFGVLLLIGQQNNSQQHINQPQNTQAQHAGTESKPVPQPSASPTSTQQDAEHARRSDNQDQTQKVSVVSVPEEGIEKKVIDRLTLFFTFVLAVTAVFGTCYALQTLHAIKHEAEIAVAALKQTGRFARATAENARLAQQSADSVKNIYRAWVLFVWQQQIHGTAEEFVLSVKNWGQTPARVEIAAFNERVWMRDDLGSIPKPDVFLVTPRILAPSEVWEIGRVNAKGVAGNEWNAVYSGKKVCVWYGEIFYRNVIDESILHETGFCYWYSPKQTGLHAGGPSGSNRAT